MTLSLLELHGGPFNWRGVWSHCCSSVSAYVTIISENVAVALTIQTVQLLIPLLVPLILIAFLAPQNTVVTWYVDPDVSILLPRKVNLT
jgi:hypothetical protein